MELEFQISYNMHIPMEFNNKEFFDLVWMYERLAEQRHNENEAVQSQNNKKTGMTSLGPPTRGFNAPK